MRSEGGRGEGGGGEEGRKGKEGRERRRRATNLPKGNLQELTLIA